VTEEGRIEADASTGGGSAVGGSEKLVIEEVLRSGTEGSQEQTRNYRGWFIKQTNGKNIPR